MALGADVHRVAGEPSCRHDCAVEALEQTAHERQAGRLGGIHDLLAVRQAGGHRLLHQQRQALGQYVQGHRVMGARRGGDDHRVHAGEPGQVRGPADAVPLGDGPPDLLARVHDHGELGARRALHHSGVQGAHGACADNSDGRSGHGHASTA
jgi:hypothetical protein